MPFSHLTPAGRAMPRHARLRKRIPQRHRNGFGNDNDEDAFESILNSLSSAFAQDTSRPLLVPTTPTSHGVTAVAPPKATTLHSAPAQNTPLSRTSQSAVTTTSSTATVIPTTTSSSIRSSTSLASSHTSSSAPTVPVASSTPLQNAPQEATNSGSVKSGSNSTGLAVGLTIGILALVGLIGLGWFLRKKKMEEREKWRKSWKAGLYPALESRREAWSKEEEAAMSEKKALFVDTSKPLPDPLTPANLELTPPPSTVNNPINVFYQSPSPVGFPAISSSSSSSGNTATVRRGFLPSLPDELPVNVGETVQVVSAYDDGWCLCRNTHGERGMVPLECLNRSQGRGSHMRELSTQDANGDQWRMSRRASSLYAGMAPGNGY